MPTDVIDIYQTCLISVDMGGPNISLEARITKIIGDQTLQMVLEKSVSHEQMREFFRVDARNNFV